MYFVNVLFISVRMILPVCTQPHLKDNCFNALFHCIVIVCRMILPMCSLWSPNGGC